MKTLVAKPFRPKCRKLKARKSTVYIDRGRGRRLGAKSNRYARTQKSSNSLIRFRCSNSCFLLETDIAGHERLFLAKWHPKSRKKTAKTAVFRHRWQAWKVVRSIAAVRQRPRTPRNWRCSFAFFETFLWHFNRKQRAEVIFRLSRPVSCKNQENGSGKRWSLHAPLNRPILSNPSEETEKPHKVMKEIYLVTSIFCNTPPPPKKKKRRKTWLPTHTKQASLRAQPLWWTT